MYSVQLANGIKADSFKAGQKIYMSPEDQLPMVIFTDRNKKLPPKGPRGVGGRGGASKYFAFLQCLNNIHRRRIWRWPWRRRWSRRFRRRPWRCWWSRRFRRWPRWRFRRRPRRKLRRRRPWWFRRRQRSRWLLKENLIQV